MLLSLGALAFRCQVSHALDHPRFVALPVSKLTKEGSVPWGVDLELLGDTFMWAASTAGGVRPPLQPLLDKHRGRPVLAAAWIATATVPRWASHITLTPAPAVAAEILEEYAVQP